MECSHGWRLRQQPKPVVASTGKRTRPGGAEETLPWAEICQGSPIPVPLRGTRERDFVPRVTLEDSLHPWLQSSAPSGANVR